MCVEDAKLPLKTPLCSYYSGYLSYGCMRLLSARKKGLTAVGF